MRRLLLLALFAPLGYARISELRPSSDGSHLLFTVPVERSVYEWSGGEPHLIAKPESGDDGSTALYAAGMSADGSVVCYLKEVFLPIPNIRFGTKVISKTIVLGPDGRRREFDGVGQLSANGRYLALRPDEGGGGLRVDLETDASSLLPPDLAIGGIANDGTVAAFTGRDLVLWKPDAARIFRAEANVSSVAISASSEWVVFQTVNRTYSLASLEVRTGTIRLLDSGEKGAYALAMTDDGRTVVFIPDSLRQAKAIAVDGTGPSLLTKLPEGVFDLAISGSGNVVYASTDWTRLIAIDLTNGDSREIFPPASNIGSAGSPRVPGSIASIENVRLTAAQQSGVRIRVDGKEAPVVDVSADRIRYQLPWDLDTNGFPPLFEITVPASGNPFEKPFSAKQPISHYWRTYERAEQLGRLTLPARHRDDSIVDRDHPAAAGEELHVLLTGLGLVQPHIATGVVTPRDPTYLTLIPFECSIGGTGGSQRSAPVTFSGLAPGFVGIYKIAFTIPEVDLPTFELDGARYVGFDCGIAGANVPEKEIVIFVLGSAQ